jgi:N-acetylglucosamine-6-phosphate deacetylase
MVMNIEGQLVLEDRVAGGRLTVDGEAITSVALDEAVPQDAPFIAPGFVDVHVHGWGGHDAMGGREALDGMARALLRRGVTSFLPTAVSAPLERLHEFADTVREWIPESPADGAQPLGFNLEGPFLAEPRRGAHDPAFLQVPANVPRAQIEPLVEGMRVITIAPELPGALELIGWLHGRGVAVSLGHSAATLAQAVAGYMAGATTTTHLFNAMTGIEHHAPGLAVAALLDDDVYTELICDGIHVDRALWPVVIRVKPPYRVLLVTDAIYLAGTGDGQGNLGGLAVEVKDGRVTLAGTSTLAGSVLSLDVAVRNLVGSGVTLPVALGAASRNPLALLGIAERGRLAAGQRADLVELDADLNVRRVMRAGVWAYQA